MNSVFRKYEHDWTTVSAKMLCHQGYPKYVNLRERNEAGGTQLSLYGEALPRGSNPSP